MSDPDPDSDGDALSWAGDDDATLAPGWKRVGNPSPVSANSGSEAATAGGSGVTASGADEPGRRQTGSVELVVLGILGGVFLLYTIGWVITAVRTVPPAGTLLGEWMYMLGLWAAALAPALWFGFVLAAVAKPATRLVWLAVGAIVLIPLPFVLGVAA